MADTFNRLLIATSNSGKLREIQLLLTASNAPVAVLSLGDYFGDMTQPVEPDETGATYAENAELKARYYGGLSGLPTVADDSGLSINELDGFPGVKSARWHAGTDSDRTSALLSLLDKQALLEPAQRRAVFTCGVCLFVPTTNVVKLFIGRLSGTIAAEPAGAHGFGYDPVFVPDGYSRTLAELGPDIKKNISHRARALTQLAAYLAAEV